MQKKNNQAENDKIFLSNHFTFFLKSFLPDCTNSVLRNSIQKTLNKMNQFLHCCGTHCVNGSPL